MKKKAYRELNGAAQIREVVASRTVERVASFNRAEEGAPPRAGESDFLFYDYAYVTYFTDGSRLEMLFEEGEPGYSEYTPGSDATIAWRFYDR